MAARPAGPLSPSLLTRLECPACQELLRDAVVTSCGHTFCLPCAEAACGGGGLCPTCRASPCPFVPNLLIRDLIGDLSTTVSHGPEEVAPPGGLAWLDGLGFPPDVAAAALRRAHYDAAAALEVAVRMMEAAAAEPALGASASAASTESDRWFDAPRYVGSRATQRSRHLNASLGTDTLGPGCRVFSGASQDSAEAMLEPRGGFGATLLPPGRRFQSNIGSEASSPLSPPPTSERWKAGSTRGTLILNQLRQRGAAYQQSVGGPPLARDSPRSPGLPTPAPPPVIGGSSRAVLQKEAAAWRRPPARPPADYAMNLTTKLCVPCGL